MALNINGTTGISGVDGSNSSPAIQGSDSNTGLSFASDTVNINTGGTTRATIDSAGALDVPSDFPIKVNGSEKLRIDSSGNVGIGKTPSDRLDVQTTHSSGGRIATFYNSDSGNNGGLIIQGGQNDGEARLQSAGGSSFITFYTEGSSLAERVRIDSSGNVGFGTTPRASTGLHISRGGGESRIELQRNSSNTTGNVGIINFTASDGHSVANMGAFGDGDNEGAYLTFRTTSNASDNSPFGPNTSERMRIDSSGNIGAPTGSNIYNPSDLRVKKNVNDIDKGLSTIKALRPVSFNWIDGFCDVEKDTLYGFIAQEVEAVDSNLIQDFATEVTINGNKIENVLRVNEKFIIPMAVKAIQELLAKVETLEAENTQMKTDLTALATRVTALEAG